MPLRNQFRAILTEVVAANDAYDREMAAKPIGLTIRADDAYGARAARKCNRAEDRAKRAFLGLDPVLRSLIEILIEEGRGTTTKIARARKALGHRARKAARS